MAKKSVILIFDVGKTNKKILLFDEEYHLVYEESTRFNEITDEDGFPCEDVFALTDWVRETFERLIEENKYAIKAVNISAYGASFVYLDNDLQVIPPLYNYLKPYSPQLQKKFYDKYGGESLVARQTASPVLGNLNSGMQLYRLKYEKPEVFKNIAHALHLPQYLSFILSSKLFSEITSIGCHTNLWNFQEHHYHKWVKKEGLEEKLPPVTPGDIIAGTVNNNIPVGTGLHDSSAALIPYLFSFKDPFLLLSTGTWCISLNPFNNTMLSDYELDEDCLCYLSYQGKAVKASRLFAGYEHEQQVKRLAEHFNKPLDYYSTVSCDPAIIKNVKKNKPVKEVTGAVKDSGFQFRKLEDFADYEEAYHQLISDIVLKQIRSTNLVLKGVNTKRIFVDGGFSKNPIYMHLLAEAYHSIEVYAASVPQASALGAALSMHKHWNSKKLPADIINLKLYTTKNKSSL